MTTSSIQNFSLTMPLEAGKRRLAGDTTQAVSTGEVKHLLRDARELKEVVAQQSFLNSPYSDPYQKRSLFLIRAAAKQHKAVINDLCRQLCGYSLHVVWRADGIDVEGNEVKAGEASQ